MQNKGQVTIFVIIAVIAVAVIILFFAFKSEIGPGATDTESVNPEAYMKGCLREKVETTLDTIAIQGGYMYDKLNYSFTFTDEGETYESAFLCYTHNYFVPCVNQEPMLLAHLKKEVENEISDTVSECMDNLEAELESKNYEVGDVRYDGFSVELLQGKVIVQLDNQMSLSKNEESKSYKNFKIIVPTKFYDIATVAQEIVAQEARFCNFEYLGYMAIYPEFDITKFNTGDSITIYTVEHTQSKEKFRFAIRGCVMPPGGGL